MNLKSSVKRRSSMKSWNFYFANIKLRYFFLK